MAKSTGECSGMDVNDERLNKREAEGQTPTKVAIDPTQNVDALMRAHVYFTPQYRKSVMNQTQGNHNLPDDGGLT